MMYDPSILEVGKRVHNAIDGYYKGFFTNETTEQNIFNTTYGILRNQWDTTLPPEFLKKAHTCVVNFAKWEINNLDGLATKPITECKIYSGDLMGIVDYLDLSKQKAVDFKTNSNAGISHDNKMQAVMYRKLIGEKFNTNINNFSFLFLFIDSKPKNVWLGDLNLLEIEKELIMYKDKIKTSWETMDFPKEPRTPSGCRQCSYRFYCGGVNGNSC